jgi:hypothetical protein
VIAVFISIYLIGQVNYKILKAEPRRTWQTVVLHDLVAIECKTGESLVPEGFRTAFTTESQLCSAYDPKWVESLFSDFANPQPPLHFNALAAIDLPKIWLHAIIQHPAVYVFHRLAYFKQFLRINEPSAYFYLFDNVIQNSFNIAHKPNALTVLHIWYVQSFETSILMKPWFWLAISLGLIVIAVRNQYIPMLLLTCSGLFYSIPYLFIGPAPDLRYAYWSIFSPLVGILQLLMLTDWINRLLKRFNPAFLQHIKTYLHRDT